MYNDFVGRLTTPASALQFFLAGNAYVTLRSARTGTRYTYRISRAKEDVQNDQGRFFPAKPLPNPQPETYFVALLSGPENTDDYVYLGIIRAGEFRLTRKSRMNSQSIPVKAFGWTMAQLKSGNLPAELEIWHQGRCGRCGRMLTVPESIAAGIGPECAERMGL